ncbi:hypothetical protein ABD91_01020 [Lysinibacillus sphaericus]|uniref:hypothetical protein n=1 Tax=Lysinibacillus sphaericus TaxID=1421 RepID=UPI0018CDB09C|nr:hypothetical protein [Lysinibacillus sphaericus]MBG9689502.1 hypothetical protein [Lysinibacillus sphaericus]
MQFRKHFLFIICTSLFLVACGKEEVVEVDKTGKDVPPSERYATDYVEPVLSEDEKFMEEYNISLNGKEVQFNLANNLNKEFYLNGNVELCDYYNYGYTNEKAYFCGQLTPVDGGYSDSWYLYFHRDSFDNVYHALLEGNIDMQVSAKIPSKAYERGQGNMAIVQRMKAY